MSLLNSPVPGRPGASPSGHPPLGAPARVIPTAQPQAQKPAPAPADDEGSIGLVDEGGGEAIKVTGTAMNASVRRDQWKRQAAKTGSGAVRVRTFHGRLSQQGLEYMDNQINEWLDVHTEVEIKFVTSNVGVFEGKMREPALIVNLWY